MTTAIEGPRELNNAMIVCMRPFLPVTGWPELEEARTRHERSLAEYRDARIDEARTQARHRLEVGQELQAAARRVLDAEDAAVDPGESEGRRGREVAAISVRVRAADIAVRNAVYAALRLVELHPEWAREIAGRRAAVEVERDELLARAAEAAERAHSENHLERWLEQAATSTMPQPFEAAGPPPAPPATVAEVFATADLGWAA